MSKKFKTPIEIPALKVGSSATAGQALVGDALGNATFQPLGKGFVNHGAVGTTARPSGYTSIEWVGSVTPANAMSGDTWINTA